jgi:hypothetical protein
MVAFHKEFPVSPTITAKSMFRNKIPETLKPGCLCNGMKTPDDDCELHLDGTAKPGIQETLDCRGISGTWMAAHDSAATWTMNIFTGSPLMSTVASLPFFLFTLPYKDASGGDLDGAKGNLVGGRPEITTAPHRPTIRTR